MFKKTINLEGNKKILISNETVFKGFERSKEYLSESEFNEFKKELLEGVKEITYSEKNYIEPNSLFFKVLEGITDYSEVELNDDEYQKIAEITMDTHDYDDMEREINLFIESIGFDYNTDTNTWYRKDLK